MVRLRFDYALQESPRRLTDAFILGEKFIGTDSCALVLSDYIFYGIGFTDSLKNAVSKINLSKGGLIFAYYVKESGVYARC